MAAYGSMFSDDLSMSVYGVNCTGLESVLFNCPVHLSPKGIPYTHCNSDSAGVICQGTLYKYLSAGFSGI